MAVYELSNDVISIKMDSRGAELKSLVKRDTGTEYMWRGDPKYWGRTSPILFPFVGGVRDREYRTGGKSYSMTQHGFARDMEFEMVSRSEEEIWFRLESDEETLSKFPFAFVLKAGYRIEGNKVKVLWQVENPGGEELYFSIGGHPAFNCPIDEGTRQEEYFVDFGDVEEVVSTGINEKGLAMNCSNVYPLTEGRLALTPNLFDADALVIENSQTDTVALCRKDGSRYLTVTMDAPLFGVWSPAGKGAPFVCIEPWCGCDDYENCSGDFRDKPEIQTCLPGASKYYSLIIERV